MRELPFLLNGPMVRAERRGLKTQSRRPAPQPPKGITECTHNNDKSAWFWWNLGIESEAFKCKPFGKPGDRLYVRETWAAHPLDDEGDPPQFILFQADGAAYDAGAITSVERCAKHMDYPAWQPKRWRPSIHMPRWASRTLLDVVDVRLEPIQNITEEDAIAEGVEEWIESLKGGPFYNHNSKLGAYPVTAFARLWDSIYGAKPELKFDANPWVWVGCWNRVEAKAVAA